MWMELLPLIGGGVFGAITKLFSMSMKYKAEQSRLMMALATQRQDAINEVNKLDNKESFSFAKRMIAFSITGIVVAAFAGAYLNPDVPIHVMTEIKTGGSYLFGLVDTTATEQVWTELKGAVVLPEVVNSFKVIIGAYFGASIASSR